MLLSGHFVGIVHGIPSKSNQVLNLHTIPNQQIKFQDSSINIVKRYLADKVKMPRTTKGNNSVNISQN